MKRSIKRLSTALLFALMFTAAIGSITTVYAEKINYSRRAQTAKKNLVKEVRKMYPEVYIGNPLKRFTSYYVKITNSRRNGRYLTCTLKSNFLKATEGGWPEEVGVVRVDLKTGVVKVIHSKEMFASLKLGVSDDDSNGDWDPYTYKDFKIKIKLLMIS